MLLLGLVRLPEETLWVAENYQKKTEKNIQITW